MGCSLIGERASQVVPVVKNTLTNAGDIRDTFDPWVQKIPWRRKGQPTPVFLPGKSHGQQSLVAYSPWGCKELDTTAYTHRKNNEINEKNAICNKMDEPYHTV